MSAFEFTAMDTAGSTQKGVLEGDSPRQVRQQLRERGLTPLNVEEVHQRESRRSSKQAAGRGISASDLALFTRQLATLIEAGLPLEEALQAVGKQTEKPRMQSAILAVGGRIKEGHSLAEAFADFPNIFPELYRATVGAGEQTGHLDVVLSRLADYTENRQALLQSITQALIYPAVLTFTALAVVSLLLGYVVPQVIQVFNDIGQTLPWLTRALIAISGFVRDYGLLLIALLFLATYIVQRLLKDDAIRSRYDGFLLELPLLGRLVRGVNTARFARTFSILTSSGVPILEGLKISTKVMANRPMRKAVEQATDRVREGSSLEQALAKSHCFPAMLIHLIRSRRANSGT